MIGKIVTGKSFGGAVRYLLGKEPGKAYILTSDGVELTSRQALIGSFEFQRRARPDVNGSSDIFRCRSTPTMPRGCRTS